MKKNTPVDDLTNRLKVLIDTEMLITNDIFDYLDLKDSLYGYLDKNSFRKKEFEIIVNKTLQNQIIKFENKIPEIVKNAKKWISNYALCMPLNESEIIILKDQLENELQTYKYAIYSITGKEIERETQTKLSPISEFPKGRNKGIYSFKGTKFFTKNMIDKLATLNFGAIELFDEKKNPELADKLKELFDEVNVSDISNKYKIFFQADTHIVAFIFYWFEKNGFIDSAYKAIDECECFLTNKNTLLKSGNLQKVKSKKKFTQYVTLEPPKIERPAIPEPEDRNGLYLYINYWLHEKFSQKSKLK